MDEDNLQSEFVFLLPEAGNHQRMSTITLVSSTGNLLQKDQLLKVQETLLSLLINYLYRMIATLIATVTSSVSVPMADMPQFCGGNPYF